MDVYASAAAGLLAVGDGETFWVEAGAGSMDLYRAVGGVATRLGGFGSGPVRTLTSFGAIGDSKMVEDGAMAVGMPVLTSATAGFTSADVGKAVVVGGAGASGGKLKSTIIAHVSATEVILGAVPSTDVTDAGVAWGTDCSAAFQAGLDSLETDRGGTLILDGHFLLTEPVAKAFVKLPSRWLASAIVGTGTDSSIVLGVDASETALTLSGTRIDMRDFSWIGVPKAGIDAGRVIALNDVVATIERCQFQGIATADQCVIATYSWFKTKDCMFGGSFPLSDGMDSSVARSVVYVDQWYEFREEGSHFIDYGYWGGMLVGKSGDAATSAWIGIGTAIDTYLTSGARNAGLASLRHTRMDEGSLRGVWFEPGAASGASLELVGTRHNVHIVAGSCGVHAVGADSVLVDRCTFGLADTPGTAFGRFADCGRVTIDRVILRQGVDKIIASNVEALVVRDTEIANYDLTGTCYYPEDSRAGGLAIVKPGPISDSDFPAAPAQGAQGFDKKNGRFYVRASGGWVYFDMAGGDLLGPELIDNGTFSVGATGWTAARSATLSVVSDALRITNGATYGRAVQAVAVEIGKTYVFSANLLPGTALPLVRVGAQSGEVTGGGSLTASGTFEFVAAFSTMYVTLILNSETIGAYAGFDNVSLREK